ncbi:DUF349 domain-containing protein [Balneolaceae bacterium YR4-1]|uniref:DUF349 domain-containing protein n=1 Tax=Halalkalibaculum roseum TaxID=2709311 RepID=A0A6M1SR67_9BACT|nr:DUF349 domain-containing protein [Halalkalibaculum roseum]NGP77579.1 DUF349 domain-containing protein [Halalkalibaculum roseum]
MEESNKTSQYIYEDEYSFLTEKNELFLKESLHFSERKLSEVEEGELESSLKELKEAFSKLEEEVEQLVAEESPSLEEVESLKDALKNKDAIGDFDALFDRLNSLDITTSGGDSPQEEEQEATSDTSANTETAEEKKEETTADNSSKSKSSEAEKTESVAKEDEETDGNGDEESSEDSIEFYKDILQKTDSLIKQDDWPYVTMELDNLSRKWGEGPDLDTEEVGKLYSKFTSKVEEFEKRKQEHYEKLNEQKKENLERKKKLLSQLRDIVENEQWTATGKVGSLKNKWGSVGQLPKGEGEDLDEKFDRLISTFNDHKVDRLVEKRQKEEDNLMIKLIVLDKMENVAGSIDETTSDWKKIDDQFEDLTKQWKKIGRVPKEKSNEVWQRYKNAQDLYYDNKYKFDKKHQSKVDKFRDKKENIIEEAETLLEQDDLAKAARKINKLHRRWKKVGNLPQRLEDKLWDRFKAATDAFNERKSKNSDKLHEQEEQHYREKLELIEEAEAIKDTTDWDKGHKKMQSLMDKWKAVGPVPRKKSNKIWKKFKGAMDVFYDRRREHFKEVKEERKDNLEEKKEILEELQALGQHEDPIEAVNIAKKLQAKFKDAGYVPIKKKNKIWKQYREACDVIYDRFRAAKSGDKFDQELAKADLDSDDRSKIQSMRKEYKKIQKEVRQLEEEVIKFQETKTYFKPSKKGNSLLDEVEQKIENAEEKLQDKQDKLESITREMEEIKDEA